MNASTLELVELRRRAKRYLTSWSLSVSALRPLSFSLRGLGVRDRAYVLLALVYLIYVESFLRHNDGDFAELVRLCRARADRWLSTKPTEPQEQITDQTVWSVRVAMGCVPHARCLGEAFTTYLLLRRRGLPATVVIGVCNRPLNHEYQELAAHAWTELYSAPLHQSIFVQRVYAPILRVGE